MTLTGLANAMGVSARTVTRWESDPVSPEPETIERLAAVLDFPVAFLTADDLEELPLEAVSFRALTKTGAGLRHSALAAGCIAADLSRWVGERFRLPAPDVPTLPGYEPETAAQAVRERWGLGTAPIPHLLDLLESRGIRVFSLATDVSEIDAFSFFRRGTPFVLVNTGKTGERQRFDAAHELGHLVMHCEDEAPSGREAELQAQRFAAAFLMPREDVMGRPLWNVDARTIIRAKARWRVAAMALTHRLRELEMLTEWGYRDACVQLSQAGYRRGEPFAPIVPETSQILRKVFSSLRDQGVTAHQVAKDLHLTEAELNRHIFGLVPVALDGDGQGGGSKSNLRLVPTPQDVPNY